jgi:hypothetical protein
MKSSSHITIPHTRTPTMSLIPVVWVAFKPTYTWRQSKKKRKEATVEFVSSIMSHFTFGHKKEFIKQEVQGITNRPLSFRTTRIAQETLPTTILWSAETSLHSRCLTTKGGIHIRAHRLTGGIYEVWRWDWFRCHVQLKSKHCMNLGVTPYVRNLTEEYSCICMHAFSISV